MKLKYRLRVKRKEGKPFLLLLTAEEHEYLERIVLDRGGSMALYLRGLAFPKGWRRKLDDLRRDQTPVALPPKVL